MPYEFFADGGVVGVYCEGMFVATVTVGDAQDYQVSFLIPLTHAQLVGIIDAIKAYMVSLAS